MRYRFSGLNLVLEPSTSEDEALLDALNNMECRKGGCSYSTGPLRIESLLISFTHRKQQEPEKPTKKASK